MSPKTIVTILIALRHSFRFVLFAITCISHLHANALQPEEILVVANRNANHSTVLAKYYMQKRAVPERNFISLNVNDSEHCSRDDYDKMVAAPIRKFLKENASNTTRIRCLVLLYGLPLKIFSFSDSHRNKNDGSNPQITSPAASLDSEIALILANDYPLEGWVLNPYYAGFQNRNFSIKKEDVLMVSRLDGPSENIVRKIIDDSIYAEKNGLKGTAYFDARWPQPHTSKLSGYELYDNSIHRAALRVRKTSLGVVVNDSYELFRPKECPDAALYCGWYSLSNYVDAFTWNRGAVGYHIASGECVTLKRKNSRAWCKMMLEKGVSATIGPVGEPFVQAFPMPELFFGFLVEGYLTLAECYLVSTPFFSWKMLLIGDPLYRPFAQNILTP